MIEDIIKQFDGYDRVVEDIETSRKYGVDYSASADSPNRYIDLLHPASVEVRVSEIIEESPSAKTFRLIPVNGYLPPFLAGQYVALFVEKDGVRTGRPYSISSSPCQRAFYDITVRRVEDGFVSNYLLDEVAVGGEFTISGPSGNFYFNPLFHDKTMVMIAGGSGVTPFMSMVLEIVEKALDRYVYLFYGNTSPDEAIFHYKLVSISQRADNVQYIPVIERPSDGFTGQTGLITGELIRDIVGALDDKTFFLCGPQGMYDFCMPELQQLGIPRRKIRNEVYGVPRDITTDPVWPADVHPETSFTVHVKGKGSFQAKAGVPLLVTLERNGVFVPQICRSGECSMCMVKVLAGKVFQPTSVKIRKSDLKYGNVHTCAAYPLEDLEILLRA